MRTKILLLLICIPLTVTAGSKPSRFTSFWQDFWSGFKNTIDIFKNGTDIPLLGNLDCGQEGQLACVGDIEYWETGWKGCDYGLKKVWNWRDGKSYCYNDKRRSADIPEWLVKTLSFQRSLLNYRPVYRNIFIGAHNTQAPSQTTSFLKSGFGTLVINQIYSITDLLNMGIRSLSVDVHYLNRAFRVCHGTEEHWGCGIRSRFFSSWLEELKIWMDKPENIDELVHIHLEVSAKQERVKSMIDILKHFFKDQLNWIPEGIERSKIPLDQKKDFILRGQRLIVQTQFHMASLGGESILRLFDNNITRPGYPGTFPENFDSNECTISGQGGLPNNFNVKLSQKMFKMDEQDVGIINMNENGLINRIYRKFSDQEQTNKKKINADTLRKATNCYLNMVWMDKIIPSKLFPTVWSWDIGEPLEWGRGKDCALFQPSGRWKSAFCEEEHSFACLNQYDQYDWKITSEKGPWKLGEVICRKEFGDSFFYSMALDPYQNEKIKDISQGLKVWLNYSTPENLPEGIKEEKANLDYTIRPVISLKYLGVMKDDSVRQFNYIDHDEGRNFQIWIFERAEGSNIFTIKNKENGRCLEGQESDDSQENSSPIKVKTCEDSAAQKWLINYEGGGNYQLINSMYESCLQIPGDEEVAEANYTYLISSKCEYGENQLFKMETP